MDEIDLKYQVIQSRWLSSNASYHIRGIAWTAIFVGVLAFNYRQWGVRMLLVGTCSIFVSSQCDVIIICFGVNCTN